MPTLTLTVKTSVLTALEQLAEDGETIEECATNLLVAAILCSAELDDDGTLPPLMSV